MVKWNEIIICESAMPRPAFLYHATYRPYLRKIKAEGLHGDNPQKNHEDSQHGLVYLALTPEVAASHAEASETVPDEYLEQIVVLQVATAGLDPALLHADRNVIGDGGTFEYAGRVPPQHLKVV
jgi:hypothetical protein